jgi:hypothetical protein
MNIMGLKSLLVDSSKVGALDAVWVVGPMDEQSFVVVCFYAGLRAIIIV